METQSRMHINQSWAAGTDWKAAAWAGVIAGVVFMTVEMLLVWLVQGESPWGPPRMMAAMLMGTQVLPPPADFSLPIMAVAMMVHLLLSVAYGLVFALLAHRLQLGGALVAGAAFGLIAVYAVNFYLIAPLLFPWFTMARGTLSLGTHVLFGLVLGGAYRQLRRP